MKFIHKKMLTCEHHLYESDHYVDDSYMQKSMNKVDHIVILKLRNHNFRLFAPVLYCYFCSNIDQKQSPANLIAVFDPFLQWNRRGINQKAVWLGILSLSMLGME